MSRILATATRALAAAGSPTAQGTNAAEKNDSFKSLINYSVLTDLTSDFSESDGGGAAIPFLQSTGIAAVDPGAAVSVSGPAVVSASTGVAAAASLTSAPAGPASAPTAATTTQAAAAPTGSDAASSTVTLLNAALVTQNTDGSTSVFGARGNAIENISATGVLILGAPIAEAAPPAVPIWYAPADEANYFANILDNPDIFSTIAGGISVFKMYSQLMAMPDATLKAFFAFLAQNNIKLGIEAAPLVAGPGQSGYGIESFAGPGDLLAVLNRIKSLGGTLSYIGWDEPLWYGDLTTGIDTVSQLATQVAASSAAARAIFPNVQIGDIEPIGEPIINSSILQTWWSDYAANAGTPFTSFQADVATWTPGWEAALASTISLGHANNMTVGVVINGLDAAPTDAAWATQADANAQLILSDPLLRPDFVIVQSWETDPSEAGDPTIAGTLPSVAADVSGSEPADLAVTAAARYNTAGFLQSVTWTGGGSATLTGGNLVVLSASGTVLLRTTWSNVQKFAFDPNTATVSLTDQVLTSTIGATPVWASRASSIGLNSTGTLAMTAPVSVAGSLSVGLAAASQTGFVGSGITNLTKPALAGTAATNAVVGLKVDGISAGSATASSSGAWNFTLTAALTAGAHVVQAAVTNSTTGVTTQQESIVTVDTATPAASTLTLANGSDSFYPDDDITDVTQPIFLGVADPSTEVAVRIDGTLAATVETNLAGQWSYAVNSALSLGTHTITATAINPAGTQATPAKLDVTIDTAAAEAAAVNPDPLFDTAWYLLNNPSVTASVANASNWFNSVGWMTGAAPSPFFSTNYYVNMNPDVLAAHVSPLLHFENFGWKEGRDPSPTENTTALATALPGLPAGEDPIIGYIQTFEYSDAIISAMPTSVLAVSLRHDTGASSADAVTDDPTLAITADPGATLTIAIGTLTPETVTIGDTGSWSFGYAPAALPDGKYTAVVTEIVPGGTATSTATLSFTLDRTAPAVTAVAATPTGPLTLGAGNVETIALSMSKTVRVTGTPSLTLNDGGVATYVSGSGGKTLDFSYTVAAGQNTAALAVSAVNLTGGASILDTAGNAANLAGADVTLAGPMAIGAVLASSVANVGVASGGNTNAGTITAAGGLAGAAATLAINLSDTPASGGALAVPAVWNNQGTIQALPGGTIDITGASGGDLVNSGKLLADGMMFIGPEVTGTGKICVGTATGTVGTLEVQGSVAAGQTVHLRDGTLIIDDLGGFLGTIKNFNSTDTIELNGVNATAVAYANGILYLDGGSNGSLHLQPASNTSLSSSATILRHVDGSTILTIGAIEGISRV